MAMGPRLDLRQSQSLVMTPQLQQAIKLLALSNIEIEAFIAGELERNPLLEIAREEPSAPENDAPQDQESTAPTDASAALGGESGEIPSENPLDVDYARESFNPDGPGEASDAGDYTNQRQGASPLEDYRGPASEDGPDFDSFQGAQIGLHEHLLAQARSAFEGVALSIATYLIAQIDAAGYLEADLSQVAILLDVPKVEVEGVLARLQTFDPVGVGARTLSECLELQARDADRFDPCMARLIGNLDLLAKGALPQLRRICGVDDEDMADMIRELRGYDPKPGLKFASDVTHSVIPDIFVTQQADGWAIELNSANLPRLLVNRRYYTELSAGKQDKSSKAWLSECLASANWLLKALDQRQRTIITVATEIVRQQEEFFRHGISHLKPLTLRAVADAVSMHESTISRVTSNKYLSCKRGVFELKFFFTSGISAADGGEAVSAEAVKSRIKALIQAEDPRKILSDDTLVDMLRAEGFDIARRTVAKYREALGIGSSVQRRRQKLLAGGG